MLDGGQDPRDARAGELGRRLVAERIGKKLPADFSGPQSATAGMGLPPGLMNPPRPLTAADTEESLPQGALGPTPGTMVLVTVFLAAFILYYFVNWNLLSFVWKVG